MDNAIPQSAMVLRCHRLSAEGDTLLFCKQTASRSSSATTKKVSAIPQMSRGCVWCKFVVDKNIQALF